MLNKMGSILNRYYNRAYVGLLGVLNKMGSILDHMVITLPSSLLGVLNKMGSILKCALSSFLMEFARCVKQDGFYTIMR